MKIVLGSAGSASDVDTLALLVSEGDPSRDDLVGELDRALGGALRAAIADEEFTGKKDAQLVLPTYSRIAPKRVALFGLGHVTRRGGPAELRAGAARAARFANDRGSTLALVLPKKSDAAAVRAATEGVQLGAYRFSKYLTGERLPKKALTHVTIALRGSAREAGTPSALASAVERGSAVGDAINLVRNLVNEPANELNPAALANVAHDVAKKHKLKSTILDRKGIVGAGMKLLEAVGRGSANEPRFVHVVYAPHKPRKNRKKVAIVGKGLTFDSGGLCIKQAQGMGDMKSDRAGAALSIGAIAAAAALQLDVEVHGIFASAENMPDGAAYRPGDIFGSLDGKTVEIINTDAEGRLVLADALAFASRLEPDVLIDHATLTGAIMIALGAQTAGLYANDDRLAQSYLRAATDAGEAMWHMPLLEDLRDGLKSDVADLKHTGERFGGSITAALFLREFVGKSKWIHIDLAGPALVDRPTALSPKGGTGFGLLSIVRFLESLE
jgi:leucyl aminopeptidase